MSRIEDLIAEHCPNGVEFKPLGELLDYEQPTKYLVTSTAYDDSYETPVLTAGRTFVLGRTDETQGVYPASPASPVVIFDDFTTAFKWVDFRFKAKSSAMKMITPKQGVGVDFKFVFYAMQTIRYEPQDHARHWISVYSHFKIPLPPLAVQREITLILDKMELLKAELEAELGLRRAQQRAIANNFAISLGASSEQTNSNRVALGSLARESSDPVKVQPEKSYLSLGVKWNGEGVLAREPRNGDTIKATTLFRARAGQLIYNRMFVVEGSFAIVPEEFDGAVVSSEFPLFDIDSSRVEPLWLLNHLCDPYTLKRIERQVTGTERGTMKSRRRWKSDQFANFDILMPRLEVQREIVAIRKASECLIRSLEGEILARHKQNAHYRDRLLRFEEAA